MTHARTLTLIAALLAVLTVPVFAQDDAATTVTGADVIDAPAAAPAADAVPADGAETLTDGGEAAATEGEGDQPAKKPGGLFGGSMMPMILIFGVLAIFMFMSSNTRKKQQRKHQDMLSNLQKGDKVVSIGGIVGTIVECREDELVVKIDENTRMKFARWAIRGTAKTAKDDPQAR